MLLFVEKENGSGYGAYAGVIEYVHLIAGGMEEGETTDDYCAPGFELYKKTHGVELPFVFPWGTNLIHRSGM